MAPDRASSEVPHLAIRRLGPRDRRAAVEVINTAAEWYREFLPPEELHGPEMDEAAWDAEAKRMAWWGAFVDQTLVGVMGSEPMREVVLLRHAYVLPEWQRTGVAGTLMSHVETALEDPIRTIVVGTYAANYKARGVLEKSGYRPAADPEAVLRAYYDIPEDRLLSSVVYVKRVGS